MIVSLDYETFYSQTYSLSRMSETDYILDPRFQVIMVTIKQGTDRARTYVDDLTIRAAIASIDWDNVALLSHNTRFDGSILAWHYNIVPRLYLDTLSMARAITHARTGSSSLARVAAYLGLPAKGDTVKQMIGKRREDFTPAELAEYAAYCAHDTELCRQIFELFMSWKFPHSELKVIDLALRMFIEPQVKLHSVKLAEYLNLVRAEKAQALGALEYLDKSVFSSNEKFARLLENNGVSVPVKTSPTTGEETWALARNDREFKELCADPEQPPAVQALLSVRMGVKSTIDETRSETLLNLSQRDWPCRGTAWMPVPYRYYGAHTGRFSGDGGYNFANLRRGSPLRDAIVAPEGWRIVHRDASQIECRILAWLAGCERLLSGFRDGRDVYSEFASRFYGRVITKADVRERFTGKTAVLSLGYAAGAARFRHALFIGQGGVAVDLELGGAEALVKFYREDAYHEIPALWDDGHEMICRMILDANGHIGRNRLTGRKPVPVVMPGTDSVRLPNGLSIQYPKLRWDGDQGEFVYTGPYANSRKKIYGGKLIENITSALARIVVTDVMLRVAHASGIRPFMGTYDSWDYVVPESEAVMFDELLAAEFRIAPEWAEDLPLASEGGWGKTLLEAEKGVNR